MSGVLPHLVYNGGGSAFCHGYMGIVLRVEPSLTQLRAASQGAHQATLNRIVDHPTQYPNATRGLRRAAVRGFPYSIYFVTTEKRIVVVAVLHHRRDLATLSPWI